MLIKTNNYYYLCREEYFIEINLTIITMRTGLVTSTNNQ